jgi:hypothetical protein
MRAPVLLLAMSLLAGPLVAASDLTGQVTAAGLPVPDASVVATHADHRLTTITTGWSANRRLFQPDTSRRRSKGDSNPGSVIPYNDLREPGMSGRR